MHIHTLSVPLGTPVTICGLVGYDGMTGRIVGVTNLVPSWPVVQLDDGCRLVVRPEHLREQKRQAA